MLQEASCQKDIFFLRGPTTSMVWQCKTQAEAALWLELVQEQLSQLRDEDQPTSPLERTRSTSQFSDLTRWAVNGIKKTTGHLHDKTIGLNQPPTETTLNGARVLSDAGLEALFKHTLVANEQEGLTGYHVFSQTERGEDGLMPRLRDGFLTHADFIQQNAVDYGSVNADSVSTSWALRAPEFWPQLTQKRGVFDFSWGRPGMADRMMCRVTPVTFRAPTTDWLTRTELVTGESCSGTCFRRAFNLSNDLNWKKNAIANLYHTDLQLRGTTRLNVFRSGVIGFSGENGEHLTPQLTELFRFAAQKQMDAALPMRFVSINTLHNPWLLTVSEGRMASRQDVFFSAALNMTARSGIAVKLAQVSKNSESRGKKRIAGKHFIAR
jgi:hypothetical protein